MVYDSPILDKLYGKIFGLILGEFKMEILANFQLHFDGDFYKYLELKLFYENKGLHMTRLHHAVLHS